MSQRFFIPILPVGHINGKIAPQKYKAKNTSDEESQTIPGYFYGYRRKSNPNKSCFAIRTACRNLTLNPYTTAEQENRDLFSISLLEVNLHWQNLSERKLCIDEFLKQRKYTTPRGYAVAIVRFNLGEWPARWVV